MLILFYQEGVLWSIILIRCQKINRTSPISSQRVNFANRGMSFEAAINDSNQYYLAHDIAVIHKKPTPVQIVKLITPNGAVLRLSKHTFDRHLPQTTLVFLKDIILILKRKRHAKSIHAHEKFSCASD